jgi:DNA-binding NtrC family response regulator
MPETRLDLNGASILLVDDTPANLDVLCALLEAQGYDLSLALDGPLALEIAAKIRPDLILLDIAMPGMDGYEVCQRLKLDPVLAAIPVVFITALDQPEDIIRGFAVGGVDYVTKPIRDAEVLARVRTHLHLSHMALELEDSNIRLARQNEELAVQNRALQEEKERRDRLKGQLASISRREAQRWGLEGFMTQSDALKPILDDVRLLQENTTPSVLITGESGTGKELVARAIHFGGPRRDGPFIPVNCAALPQELADSMFFGHRKGAFTGAGADTQGYFEMAHEGTLFLDELGELPIPLQAKLLRVLEDGEVWRLGDRKPRAVDVRLVAATNADLAERIGSGSFRQDLYFRVARFRLEVPPLRHRLGDIALLARHFLDLFAAEMGREAVAIDPRALAVLESYSFPGNVRELKNIIERAVIQSRGGAILPVHLQLLAGVAPVPFDEDQLETHEANEKRHITQVLQATDWVVRGSQGAARTLDLPESTLRGKIKKLGIYKRDS